MSARRIVRHPPAALTSWTAQRIIAHNTALNSRYLSTDPHFSFIVAVTENIWKSTEHSFGDKSDLSIWLQDEVGENHKDWEWWWSTASKAWLFEFKREEDKVKFILRWL